MSKALKTPCWSTHEDNQHYVKGIENATLKHPWGQPTLCQRHWKRHVEALMRTTKLKHKHNTNVKQANNCYKYIAACSDQMLYMLTSRAINIPNDLTLWVSILVKPFLVKGHTIDGTTSSFISDEIQTH